MTTLTLDQHKQAVKLGIEERQDGLWGFRKKCINKRCEATTHSHCYAAETFEEAVREVATRSVYPCSNECWAESGELWPWFADQYDDDTLATIGDCDSNTVTRLLRRLKNGSTRNLPAKDKKILEAWIQELQENYDGDYDLDDHEVGCEI